MTGNPSAIIAFGSITRRDLRVRTESVVSSISVVIPIFNSAALLPELVERLEAVLGGLTHNHEIVLINDGSSDSSWEVVQSLAGEYKSVHGLDLMRNYGQHSALLAGVRAARGDIIVTLDDDLQHPPEEIPALIAKLNEGFDVVYGAAASEQHGFWRDMASRATKFVLRTAMGVQNAARVSAFRAFRTSIRGAFSDYRSSFVSLDVLLAWGTSHFTAVTVRHDPRKAGRSNYSTAQLVRYAMTLVTGFSTLPLQFASIVGFAFTVMGLIVLAYVVGRYMIQGRVVPGFAFLASIIAIFSGAQLFALGIIGEYLARMHFRLMERPPYAIRTEVGGEPTAT